MSNYIGVSHTNRVSPSFVKEDFLGSDLTTIYVDPQAVLLEDGNKIVLEDLTTPSGTVGGNIIQDATQEYQPAYELSMDVSGSNTENLQVVLDNVIQEPEVAYTIHENTNDQPRILHFQGAVSSTASIYVVHRGVGSFQMKPPTGSVGANELAANLTSFTTDVYTGDASTAAFTLSETPTATNSVMVFVDGILQKAPTNYAISGNVLTFTSAPSASAEVEAKHFGVRGVIRRSTDWQYDSYTGDGSTTAFTLTNSGITANNAFIFYNGIALKPLTDYSISGNTLTFTFAPVNASEIMARYQL